MASYGWEQRLCLFPQSLQSTLCNLTGAFQVSCFGRESASPEWGPSYSYFCTINKAISNRIWDSWWPCTADRQARQAGPSGDLSLDVFGLGNARNLLAEQVHLFCFVTGSSPLLLLKKEKKKIPGRLCFRSSTIVNGTVLVWKNFLKINK